MPSLSQEQMSAYRRVLAGREEREAGLESMGETEAVLGSSEISDRVAQSRETLLKTLETYFGKDDRRAALVDQLLREGGEGLRMLADRDGAALGARPMALEGLEAIVRADGSRPSFLIKEGEVDRASSPLGSWGTMLTERAAALRSAVARVGRIDTPGIGAGYQGTGFLIASNLILTNRHVLQLIGRERTDGGWDLFPDTAIDFGHEFKARDSVGRRLLRTVVFCGSQPIVGNAIDHHKLDLAVIELESDSESSPEPPFVVQSTPPVDTGAALTIFTIGYPGSPQPLLYPPTLIEQLFGPSFGYKRLAPGETMGQSPSLAPWTLRHDATTLGGNSGSVVLALHQEAVAFGLHYGGRPAGPAENWGHELDKVLGQTNGRSSRTLYEVLERHGVRFTGRPRLQPVVPPAPSESPSAPATPPVASDAWKGAITLHTMRRLVPADGSQAEGAGLEAPRDGETPASRFADRQGYDPNFLPGFPAPLPTARDDMRAIRGGGFVLRYEHFSVIMSASRRMPLVTACNINGAESRSLPRVQQWNFDGRLDREHQWGNELYSGNDLDRGHMVRREDPNWGPLAVAKRANLDTFHYTNSCPQMAGVNQRVWLGLENYILSHTRDDAMLVSVFTGPFFTDHDLPYRGALIPRAFWKVVAFVLDDGRPSATAYKVSQDRELQDLEFVFSGYKTFQISIQQVADATGLDFSALIPYDGFSQHERVHGVTLTERVDLVEQIRL